MGYTCSTYEEVRSAYRILVGNPSGKRPLARPRRTWNGDIRIDVRGGDGKLMGFVQDRLR